MTRRRRIAGFSAGVAVMFALLWAGSSTAWGEGASPSDLALQAAGGLVGGAVGGLLGTLAALPTALELMQQLPPCLEEVTRVLRDREPLEEPKAFVFTIGFCALRLVIPVASGMGLSFAGGALGTVTGIALVAQAQGRSGNWLAASAGVLAGYAFTTYAMNRSTLAALRELEERLRRGEVPEPEEGLGCDVRCVLQSIGMALLPVGLGVLAFNFL